MLSSIHIQNLVIVNQLDLTFSPGMTALTGETGAGKSILIDALGLALGDKADNSMIRAACDRAEVTATFDVSRIPAAQAWLRGHDLDADDDCLLRRILVRNGRSRAYINGSPAPQGLLRELAEQLVDIHSQHAHHSLLRPAAQRQLLDAYAGHQGLLNTVADRYQEWHNTRRELDQLQQAANDRANRIDYLRFQIDELEPVICSAAELAELDQQQALLAHAEQLQRETSVLTELLSEGAQTVESGLNQTLTRLSDLARLDKTLDEPRDMVDSALIQINEASAMLRHYRDAIEIDPAQLADIDQRLGRLHDLARKHHVDTAQLADLLHELQQELDGLENADTTLHALQQQLKALEKSQTEAAEKLSRSRNKAAKKLSGIVTASMQLLGMKGGQFSIDCISDPETPGAQGIDKITFMVAANPGQSAAALSDVASGGELSRISLAIQVATADCGEVPTLIFDEVDVGIGGAVAEIVGQLLRNLGNERQVLCVTHLPQVASQGHQHLRVYKLTDGQTTETRIDPLGAQSRIDEVARMLGGVDITEQTLRHAGEMITRAQQAGEY